MRSCIQSCYNHTCTIFGAEWLFPINSYRFIVTSFTRVLWDGGSLVHVVDCSVYLFCYCMMSSLRPLSNTITCTTHKCTLWNTFHLLIHHQPYMFTSLPVILHVTNWENLGVSCKPDAGHVTHSISAFYGRWDVLDDKAYRQEGASPCMHSIGVQHGIQNNCKAGGMEPPAPLERHAGTTKLLIKAHQRRQVAFYMRRYRCTPCNMFLCPANFLSWCTRHPQLNCQEHLPQLRRLRVVH